MRTSAPHALAALLTLVASEARAAEPPRPVTLELELAFDPTALHLQTLPDGSLRAELPGYPSSGAPGEARLPTRLLRLALPDGADLAALRLEVLDLAAPRVVPLAGRLAPAAAPRLLCPAPGCAPTVPVPPADPARARATAWLGATGKLGPALLVEVIHRPVALAADGAALLLHPRQRLRLEVPLLRASAPAPSSAASAHLVAQAAALVANPADLARFHPAPRDLLPDARGVAVVAPEWLIQESRVLPDYLAALGARGFVPVLVSDADLQTLAGEPPDRLPQKLRAWLQQNREQLGLRYAILLGNPDPVYGDMPMQLVYPWQPGEAEYIEEIPTDAYFADLDGNWDKDGDGRFGEWDGDSGAFGVDFYAEILVGRIPVYGNATVADRLLQRAIDYPRPNPGSEWRRRLLLPASILFYDDPASGSTRMDGADLALALAAESELAGFESVTLFEREGLAPSVRVSDRPLTEEEVVLAWREGYGLVYWFGHGSEDAAYRTLWINDVDGNGWAGPWEQASAPFIQAIHHDQLPADRPAFVFHGSCSNGTPENAGNIGYTQLKSGAIASFSSSRVALGVVYPDWSPDPSSCEIFMAGYYVTAGLRDGRTAGEAWAETRALLSDSWWGAACWHTRMATTLYGDPTLGLANCTEDADCDDGLACDGVESCQEGLCTGTPAVDCSSLDSACTRGACAEPAGACVEEPLDGQRCDDGLFCTAGDRCQDGVCQGVPRTCEPLVEACLEGRCNEEAEACEAVRRPEGEACVLTQSGDPESTQVAGTCEAGVCIPNPEESCASASGNGWTSLALLLALGIFYLIRKQK